MLRKYKLVISLFVFCVFLLLGCAASPKKQRHSNWNQHSDRLKVLSTTAIIDNLVEEIGKEKIEHISLITGELDPHSYELVKGDAEKILIADVIFYNGLELEHGASLKYQLLEAKNAYALSEFISNKEKYLFIDGQVDPHIWMDASMMAEIVPHLAEVLAKKDSKNAGFYLENAKKLQQEILSLDKEINFLLKEIPEEKRYLITSHDAFYYFTRRYLAKDEEILSGSWKARCKAPEGLAPDGQMSPKDIGAIIDHAIHYQIQVVFTESNVNQDALRKVVKILNQKGVKAILSNEPLYGDALGDPNSNAGSYIKMMQANAKNIAKHLGKN